MTNYYKVLNTQTVIVYIWYFIQKFSGKWNHFLSNRDEFACVWAHLHPPMSLEYHNILCCYDLGMLVQNRLHRPLVRHHQTDKWRYPCMEVLLLSHTCMLYMFLLVFLPMGSGCQWHHLSYGWFQTLFLWISIILFFITWPYFSIFYLFSISILVIFCNLKIKNFRIYWN